MNYLRVEDKDGLVRDCETNAIINIDMDSYNKYIQTYKNKLKEKERIDKLENNLNEIKSDIEEIKSLLKGIIK